MEFGQRKTTRFWLGALAAILPFTGLQGDEYAPPQGYYLSVEGLTGTALRDALNERIRNHIIIPYGSLPQVYRATDVDPDNPDNLILIYNGQSMPISDRGTSGPSIWNREHVWPQSWGADIGAANSDIHHVFPCNGEVNTQRSNYTFDWTDPANLRRVLWGGVDLAPGSTYDPVRRTFEPRDADKGRVARAMFYMATRYDGRDANSYNFLLSNRPNNASTTKTFAYLDALLAWNRMFAPDERERRRNHLIFDGARVGNITYRQANRNPFIDVPEWADAKYLPASTVTYGSWRWRHFTYAELQDPAVSGDLADPDDDGVPNLVELAMNTDPFAPDAAAPLTVTWPEAQPGTVELAFPRLTHRALSGLSYHIETTTDPFAPGGWRPLPFAEEDLEIEPGASVQQALLAVADAPGPLRPRHYRLRVDRAYPIGHEGRAVYDPVAAANTSGSIFAYDYRYGPDWTWGWLGWAWEAEYPWVFLPDAGWAYLIAASPRSVWIWTQQHGWLWTNDLLFPNVYLDGPGDWSTL